MQPQGTPWDIDKPASHQKLHGQTNGYFLQSLAEILTRVYVNGPSGIESMLFATTSIKETTYSIEAPAGHGTETIAGFF
jgi:ribosomal protein S19E (S16A)